MTEVERLRAFIAEHGFARTRGALNLGLVVTEKARELSFPISPERLLAKSGGQVAGLSGAAGNRILQRYGVNRSIGTEVGRTNRGSVENLHLYIAFLNKLALEGAIDLDAIQQVWVDEFVERFAREPLRLRREAGLTIQATVVDLIRQAEARQAAAGGAMVVGAVLQHLVGAKLEAALKGRLPISHASSNANDVGRAGDFNIGDSAIHVTATPGELLIAKCRSNLDAGLRAVILTPNASLPLAQGLARQAGLQERIEVIGIETFLATNIAELGGFEGVGIATAFDGIIDRYNALIDAHEVDPSLRIAC